MIEERLLQFDLLQSPLTYSPLNTQTWPFSIEWLPCPAYLVGGGVRDALRGRVSQYLDLDFVLPGQPVAVAQQIAQAYKAGFVLLDAERQIARVVFDDATVDFALQVGPTLESDLQRRDFTVNAIAFDPHHQTIIDPLHGCVDLEHQLIRMVSAQNLAEDPLRLLRAFRQAAQLGFHLESVTKAEIRSLAPYLKDVAAERVRVELSYLLSSVSGTPLLAAAWQHGLLDYWFPDATAAGLAHIAALDVAVAELTQRWPDLKPRLLRCLSDRARGGEATCRTPLTVTKLTGLVSADVAQAEQTLQHLKYSRSEVNLVLTLLKQIPAIRQWQAQGWEDLSRRDQYLLFQAVGSAFPAWATLTAAMGVPLSRLALLVERFLDPQDAIAHPVPLVTGKDLIQHLQIKPGPRLGQILSALELAQAEGKIATAEAALQLASVWLSSG